MQIYRTVFKKSEFLSWYVFWPHPVYVINRCVRSYPSREKTARFLTADVEQLIRDSYTEKERLSAELREKVKKMTETDAAIKKSSQVKL